MVVYKFVQMILRGILLILMLVGFFFNWESEDMNANTAFLATGVFGSCFIVSLGLMLEAGLEISQSYEILDSYFQVVGILLNLAATIFIFYEYSNLDDSSKYLSASMVTVGIIDILAVSVYVVDIGILFCEC